MRQWTFIKKNPTKKDIATSFADLREFLTTNDIIHGTFGRYNKAGKKVTEWVFEIDWRLPTKVRKRLEAAGFVGHKWVKGEKVNL